MHPGLQLDHGGVGDLELLSGDGERVLYRGRRVAGDGASSPVLIVLAAAEHPSPALLDRLAHEYELKDTLEPAWAVRPLELRQASDRTLLLLEDPGGEPLERLLGEPMETGRFLRLAIDIASILGKAHERRLVHKDVKPANILVSCADGGARLTGFGVASRLPRQRQAPDPPEMIAGTLAYMAPEQTGRLNRSVDSRSDLYALGVTYYQMLTGRLPFSAAEPIEWIHCHIARTPPSPAELAGVPVMISQIVMKLLSKTAEERYQTAVGLEYDLRACLVEWERNRRIDPFPISGRDTPDRLLIPEKLYGREREVEALLAAFDRVATKGPTEMVLVSGYSGIGKSSIVNELHKALVPTRGLLASGKFDLLKRGIPYSTLGQAFQNLARQLLSKSDAELEKWREALLEALGANGRLVTDLIPELKLIIGEQPPVPELQPQQAKGRFQLVFRRFIEVFARPEHPLALFLDDLQWVDAATLDLMAELLTGADLRHLLLIGAYRDNEVDSAHSLIGNLAAIRHSSARMTEIKLESLKPAQIRQLIADALRSTPERVAPLAELVHAKTAGNPFFVLQFLHALAGEGLLAFDHEGQRWTWDLDRIHGKGFADNVVDLMVGKLARLPPQVRKALHDVACLGSAADVTTLATVLGGSEDQIHAALWEAVRQGLVERLGESYKFIHDRVQEAAYSQVPEEQRSATHLRIGRLLLTRTPRENREEAIFEIVTHLNRGAALIAGQEERDQLAELNLIAGKRAKGSTAYDSALTYLDAGAALLAEERWERQHDLIFALELHRAECEFLTGALGDAEARLAELASRATSLPDLAVVTRLRVDLFMTLGRSDRAVAVGLDYLRRCGIAWPAHPTKDEVQHEYARMWRQLEDRPIEALLDLPRMADPVACSTMDVLTSLVTPALWTDENLRCLVIGRMGNLSLEHGNSDASCYAYAAVGAVLGLYFGDYKAGFRFGQLGLQLVEQLGMDRLKARVYLAFGNLAKPSMRHARTDRPLAQLAFDTAQQAGDLNYAAISRNNLLTQLLARGDPLAEAQREAEAGLEFARKAGFGLVVDLITAQLGLIQTLRGLTPAFGRLDDVGFDEDRFERRLEGEPRLAIAACLYWIRKLQARAFAGENLAAVAAATKAERVLWMSPVIFERADYHFYVALALAALCDSASAAESAEHRAALAAHHRQLQEWAENIPENFENRAALVGAEIARLEDRDVDAMRLYEQAIRSAHANGFIHNEALANELAFRFYAARGFEKIARVYLQDARYGYLRWGADGKVRQLEEMYPQARTDEPEGGPTSTVATPVERLDLGTVIKALQTVSSEMVVEKLIDTLMRTAIAQAGAERGLLILVQGPERRMAAEAVISGDAVGVQQRDLPVTASLLPETVLNYVIRTRESLMLDDAATEPSFAADPYIRQRQARSILCLPLVNQAKLIGVLYLENNLTPRAFAPARTAVLKLVASQAAISLENTRLYQDLAEREARIRRLVDANIIGIFIWDFKGRINEANDAFLRMLGYDREDLVSGRLHQAGLTPPQWRDRDAQTLAELKRFGTVQPFEKEYFRKDGSRAPVLLGLASFEQEGNEGVAFVLDLSERRRAGEALRDVEQQLAHANRLETMGQLTASIAHEVNQPIAATVTNAQAALRWLNRPEPDLGEVRQALDRIVSDGARAGAVVQRIRNLSKRASPRDDRVEINASAREVIELTRSEAMKNGVSVRFDLAEGLPPIRGDRVELQQVMLNLILNAVEAMSGGNEPRELVISTSRNESGDILVLVCDSGPGLAPAVEENLFKAFYTTKPTGLGLGLSICRSIIERHGGNLWASANAPRGAVFQFTLPALAEPLPP